MDEICRLEAIQERVLPESYKIFLAHVGHESDGLAWEHIDFRSGIIEKFIARSRRLSLVPRRYMLIGRDLTQTLLLLVALNEPRTSSRFPASSTSADTAVRKGSPLLLCGHTSTPAMSSASPPVLLQAVHPGEAHQFRDVPAGARLHVHAVTPVRRNRGG